MGEILESEKLEDYLKLFSSRIKLRIEYDIDKGKYILSEHNEDILLAYIELD